jgi:predicted membrane GTPase involved in stress response
LVHAELAELYSRLISEVPETLNQLRNHAQLALADLQANEWIQRLEPERLRRLQHWTNASTLDQRVS